MIALGVASVPEVKISSRDRRRASGSSRRRSALRRSASANVAAPGRRHRRRRRGAARRRWRRRPRRPARGGRSRGSSAGVKIAAGRAVREHVVELAGPVVRQQRVDHRAERAAIATAATTASYRFGSCTDTTSPGSTPWARRWPATRRARSNSSPHGMAAVLVDHGDPLRIGPGPPGDAPRERAVVPEPRHARRPPVAAPRSRRRAWEAFSIIDYIDGPWPGPPAPSSSASPRSPPTGPSTRTGCGATSRRLRARRHRRLPRRQRQRRGLHARPGRAAPGARDRRRGAGGHGARPGDGRRAPHRRRR